MTVKVTRAALAQLSPNQAAALWKVRRDSGTPRDIQLFEEWLDENEAHAAAWKSLNEAWGFFDDIDNPIFAGLRANALAAEPERKGHEFRKSGLLALAACLVLALVGAIVLFRGEFDRFGDGAETMARNEQNFLEQSYSAPNGSQRFELADGTEMILGRGASARTVFANGKRQVFLDRGQARFSVRHDLEHRFEVVAGRWSIVDYGTRFQVQVEKNGLRVALFEGSVQVSGNDNRPTLLQPGKQLVARVGSSDRISDIGAEEDAREGADMAQFENATLAEAIKRFNAVNEIQLVLMDRRSMDLRITGLFRLSDPARFSAMISQLLPVKVSRVSSTRIEIRSSR